MKSVLKEPYFSHFNSLHVAIRILASEDLCCKYIEYAQSLLLYFVRKYGELYGEEHINHNVHNLLHLCSDVKNFGCLDNFSCFKFENYMSTIKKALKTSNYPLQQFIKRHYEYQIHCITTIPSSFDSVLSKSVGYERIQGELVEIYKAANYNKYYLSTSEPNCYCILNNGYVVRLLHFLRWIQKYFLKVRFLRN